jgi:hypothetical protein
VFKRTAWERLKGQAAFEAAYDLLDAGMCREDVRKRLASEYGATLAAGAVDDASDVLCDEVREHARGGA